MSIQEAGSGAPWYASAAAAAITNTVGKTLYYCAGYGAAQLPKLRSATSARRAPRRFPRTRRLVTRWIIAFRRYCREHPRRADLILLTAATTGLPPFNLIAILAGAGRYGVTRFLAIAGFGRLMRFSAVAGFWGTAL